MTSFIEKIDNRGSTDNIALQADEASYCECCCERSPMNRLLDRISIDPEICGGKPCIKGTRLWVSLILDFLADGMSEAEVIEEYPQIAHEDILAAIAYGAEAARERIVFVPVNSVSSIQESMQ